MLHPVSGNMRNSLLSHPSTIFALRSCSNYGWPSVLYSAEAGSATERVREGAHELAAGAKSVGHEIKEGVHAGKKVVTKVVHAVVETTGGALDGTGKALKGVGDANFYRLPL